jgi:hypothetical protein
MSKRVHDYVPRNAAQFRQFMDPLLYYLDGHYGSPAWGNLIPLERFRELYHSFERFCAAQDEAEITPTHANILRRQEAQAATTALLRAIVNQYLRFPPVTNVDRAAMGIPNHDTIRTDHKIVTKTVDFVIHLSVIRELSIDFWIQGAAHKAKPEGYDGAVLIWGIADAPPEKPEDLEHHIMASRTPFTLHFDETERGKTVYVALCWQNERGITGAWSEYKSAVVP